MNTKEKDTTVGLAAGNVTEATRNICRSLAEKGISAVVVQKATPTPESGEPSAHWSGQPGKDLFFNGWKLLF